MEDKITCVLVKELLPLYQDSCISIDCQEVVEKHLAECNDCSNQLSKIKNEIVIENDGQLLLNDDRMKANEAEELKETLQYQKVGKRLKRKRLQIILSTIASCLLVIIVYHTLFLSSRIASTGMEPTFQVSDNLLFSKAAYWFSSPERGDIVFINNHHDNFSMVKRVVGIPGDVLQVKQGVLYINGDMYENDGLVNGFDMGESELTVLQGEYFVLGDNLDNSLDSRTKEFGCVKESSIVAKYLFTIPFSNPFVRTTVAKATVATQ